MTKPTLFDLEQLSAYLDGELPQADRTRLEARLASEAELRRSLDDLRRTRSVLRRTPRRRAPRNFTLTPKMAGLRPPVPRLVPAFSWASAVAMLAFLFSFGAGLLPRLFSAGAPAATVAPAMAPVVTSGAQPAPTQAPAERNAAAWPTETPGAFLQAVPLSTAVAPTAEPPSSLTTAADLGSRESPTPPPAPTMEAVQPTDAFKLAQTSETSAPPPPPRPSIPWIYVWLALAVLLAGAALFTRWLAARAYRRKISRQSKQ